MRKAKRKTNPTVPVSSEQVRERLDQVGLEPRWRGRAPASFADLTDDSRQVEPGALFCAVPGFRVDGHEYVEEAREAGASAAVVERELPAVDLPQLVVADARTAVAHLAALFHGDPARSLSLTGVTGTNGKTTTAWLVRHLLAARGPAAAVGTLGVVDAAGERIPGDLTTPPPITLARTLAGLAEDGVRRVAMEVSSHALDQRRVDGLTFENVVFTNLSREHMEYHPDMEAYRRAKLRAVDLLRPGGGCVVNADEPAWRDLDPGPGERVTYGLAADVDVRAEEVRADEGGSRFRLAASGGTAEVRLPLPGRFNVHNALAAAAVGLREGLDPGAVAERLAATPQIPGRMEVLRRSPSLVIRDYAHTPEALRRVLDTLRPDDGRLLVVFGCGGERDVGKRPLMGKAAEEGAHLALITTDNPRSEDPAGIAEEVVAEMDPSSYEIVLDRREAIARALELAGPEDVVLLAGKGHETYQAMGDGKVPFDEPAIVAELTGRGRAS